MPILEIKTSDIAGFTAALRQFPGALIKNLGAAGQESLTLVLDTVGIRSYPPETAANRPPTPFYVRGIGTQTNLGNLGNSENYGKKWTESVEGFVAKAKNTASYAPFLGGENQVHWAAGYGWKKVFSTAKELFPKILDIYRGWIAQTVKEVGL